MSQLRQTNTFVQSHRPWELKNKPEQEEWLTCILSVVMETLRISGILLQPVVPNVADKLLTKLSLHPAERTFQYALLPDIRVRRLKATDNVLFPRIKP